MHFTNVVLTNIEQYKKKKNNKTFVYNNTGLSQNIRMQENLFQNK